MKVKTHSEMGTQGMTMLLDQLKGLGGLAGLMGGTPSAKDAPKAPSVDGKSASSGLDKLCATKKEGLAPKGTIREGDELKQQQDVEVAKLKKMQFGESKALYAKQEGQKTEFKAGQEKEKAKFEADHKGDKDIVAKRMKFIDGQAAARVKFEKGLANENLALSARHKGQNDHQAKWHGMQKKELEAKYAPVAKHAPVKVAKTAAPGTKSIIEEGYSKIGGKVIIETGYYKPLTGKLIA